MLSLNHCLQWNAHGYDIAKLFGNKFNFVSPVWLQVRRKRSGGFVIEGGHDIDKGILFMLYHISRQDIDRNTLAIASS